MALLVCSAILAVIVVLITLGLRQPQGDPAPAARIEHIREDGDASYVDVTVTNEGGRTAANVQVVARGTSTSGEVTADQVIDFLPNGEEANLTFVFAEDLDTEDVVVGVSGFAVP